MPGLAQSLYGRIEGRVPGYRFGGVFVLLILTYVFLASAPPTGRWVPLLGMTLMGATLLAAVLAARSGRVAFYATVIVLVGGLAAVIFAIAGGYSSEEAIAYGVSALLVLAAPVAIVRGVVQRGIIDGRTILAALSIYVLAGMLWAFIELTIQAATSHPFFAADRQGHDVGLLVLQLRHLDDGRLRGPDCGGRTGEGTGRSRSHVRADLPGDRRGGPHHESQVIAAAHAAAGSGRTADVLRY